MLYLNFSTTSTSTPTFSYSFQEHWTLWSIDELSHEEIVEFIEKWIAKNRKDVVSWNYDDNNARKTIEIPHLHVYLCASEINEFNDGRIPLEDIAGIERVD